jgi:hypothetical protein
MMPLVIAALLGLSALMIVLYPLLGLDRQTDAGEEPASEVAEREQSAKLALRDVDFDYRLGNLDPHDYEALRTRYERRALAAIKTRYEREQALDALIDEQLAALRSGTPAGGSVPTGQTPAGRARSAANGQAHPARPTRRRRRGA